MHRRYISSSTGRLADYAKKTAKKMHWADESKLLSNIQRALNHYDDFYANVYGKQWPSLKLGLLSPPKYMAIPNSFTGNIDGITGKLKEMGAYNIQLLWNASQADLANEAKELDMNKDLGRLHQLGRTLEAIAATKRAAELDVLYQNAPTGKRPGDIQLGKHPTGRLISDVSQAAEDFVPSTKMKGMEDFTLDSEYFSSYLKKHDEPLDGEMATEGYQDNEVLFLKCSESALQFPKFLIPYSFENGSALNFPAASRESSSRTSSPENVFFTKFNSRDYPARDEYSRVLVDVPCLNDRVSCTVADNNIFKPKRVKERLTLVKFQKEILLSGLKAVSKEDGNAVVYSTCTLSPIENDGVVMNALKETSVPNLFIDLVGLLQMVAPFERAGVFRVTRTRCGILVTPNTICNFGPMFISRIVVKQTMLQ